MTFVNCLEENKFSIPSESDSICANMVLSVYTPPPCKQILWKASDVHVFLCPCTQNELSKQVSAVNCAILY